jgi:endonuclease/exonuclease/phosphatase family metal-dependent hydrolase
LTGDKFNVLIDHILVSRSITATDAMVWNPFLKQATEEKTAEVKAIKEILLSASDHFPVSAVVEL